MQDTALAMPRTSFDALDNVALLHEVKTLVGRSNSITAHLLAHLAEVDARGAYLEVACPSLYKYCIYELRMSEDAAQRRVQAARAVRHFPLLLDILTDASIHLTGILLLAPHLTADNHAEVLARASFRSKREIQRLVAEIAPRPDVQPTVEPLGLRGAGAGGSLRAPSWPEFTAALAGAVRQLTPGNHRGGAPTALDAPPAPIPTPAPPDATLRPQREGPFSVVEPLSPERYRVELTVDQHYLDLLEEARDLLAHQIPDRDLAKVHARAIETLVKTLRKQRRAATEKPRAGATNCSDATDRAGAADRDGPTDRADATDRAGATGRAGATNGVDRADATNRAVATNGADTTNRARAAKGVDATTRAGAAGAAIGVSAKSATNSAGATDSADTANGGGASRYVPAATRRAVWERDQARCTYVDGRGCRCRETGGLEIHHERAFAKGGGMMPSNLALRCRPHNDLAAQQDFGREFIMRKKGQARGRSGGTGRAGAAGKQAQQGQHPQQAKSSLE